MLMSNEDKRITREELLEDRKKDCGIIDTIMGFFAISRQYRPDLERKQYNASVYDKLGWSNQYNDVINSFWTVFKCSLIVHVKFKYNDYYKDYRSCYRFLENGFPKVPYDQKFAAVYLKYTNCIYEKDLVKIVKNTFGNVNLSKLAKLCHCTANFMPCPDNLFNQVKGTAYIKVDINGKEIKWYLTYDFLPLMIDLINSANELNGNAAISLKLSTKDTIVNISNACILFSQDGKEINIKWKTIGNWKTWFVDNREKYCLEDYYNIYADPIDPNIKHIKGVPMFKTQCLSYPVPREKDEVEECLNEMVNRIMSRACRLEMKLNEESK